MDGFYAEEVTLGGRPDQLRHDLMLGLETLGTIVLYQQLLQHLLSSFSSPFLLQLFNLFKLKSAA